MCYNLLIILYNQVLIFYITNFNFNFRNLFVLLFDLLS